MDMGSSSLPSSVVCGSNDSLNGLKFGKKIYFEDVNGGAGSSKASLGSGSTPMPASVKKGKGVVQGAQQPPRCQVEGCNLDLSDAKPYYSRHKVCGMHSKSPKVIVAGLEQRFCQQCSRFHQLPEFDQGKRSCRRRLAGHNERRRKPHPGALSSRIGRLSSSLYEDNSRFRSFMMDFTHPREAASARDIWPTVRAGDRVSGNRWQAGLNALNSGIAHHGFHPYMQGSTGGTVLSNLDVLPHRSAGVSDSSCALSLLSNHQPWSSNTSRSRALTLSASSSIGGALAQSIFANGYATSSWEFKGHEPSGGSQGLHHDMEMAHVAEQDNGQFSGELELALQDNRQGMNLNPTRAFGHADDATQWSL